MYAFIVDRTIFELTSARLLSRAQMHGTWASGTPIEPAVKKPTMVCANVNYYVVRIVRPYGRQDIPVMVKTSWRQSQPMLNRRLNAERELAV